MTVTLTPTRVQLGSRCHRRHALTDVATLTKDEQPGKLRRRSNEHAAFGAVIHAGVGAYWHYVEGHQDQKTAEPQTLADLLETPRKLARAAVERSWNEEFVDDTKNYSLELALTMMDYYARKARRCGDQPNAEDYVVSSIEERAEVEVGRFRMTFQIDRSYRNGNSFILVDTKTAKTLRAGWEKSYDVSLQFKLYKGAVCRLYDLRPEDVVIIIEGVSKKVPTDIEYHFIPDWGQSILDEALMQFTRIAEADEQLLAVAAANGKLDLDLLWELAATQTSFNDNDCFAYGQPCPFLEVCNAPVEDRLALLKAGYQTYTPDWE